MHKVFSLHRFTNRENIPFNPEYYSRFKYGSELHGMKMGVELAHKFARSETFNKIIRDDKQVIVVPSPYGFIQSAAKVLADVFIDHINEAFVRFNKPPAQMYKITRDKYYTQDYASMTAEERRELINGDKFFMDADYFKNKIIIHIDDVKITGAHQQVIENLLVEKGLGNDNCDTVFVYYAELVNRNEDPSIEAFLNTAGVCGLGDIANIIVNDGFVFNTRVMKYILSHGMTPLYIFFENQPKSWLIEFYHKAIGEGYHLKPEFQYSVQMIKHHIEQEQVKRVLIS